MTQFYCKTKICYGNSALNSLESVPGKQAFLVTDHVMVKAGFVDRIKTNLARCGMNYSLFEDVEPDPSLETVTKGTCLLLQNNADVVIALGGGSVMDAAKAMVFFACKAKPDAKKPLLIAIPTTSGTGSEVTAISVVTDKQNGVKIPLNDELLIPDMALLDARFTTTVPPSVTAATGIDVLTHAIEAYASKKANTLTAIYAKDAIKSVFKYLFRAYQSGDDMEAREKLILAACMAGVAFNNSGLGLTHGIAHSLGGLFHIPHGVANAVLLPYVIKFNSFDVGTKYKEIAEFADVTATTVDEGTNNLIKAIKDMNRSMGIPVRIGELKIDEASFMSHLDTIANNALEDICTITNPRTPSHEDIKILLKNAW